MKRDHKKISPTAFNHIIWRTFFGLPFADEFAKAAEKFGSGGHIFDKKLLRITAPVIEGRYRGGEGAMEEFIRQNPGCTVLELAAGFGLHGIHLSKKYPKITYIETDLPAMSEMKEKIVGKLGLKLPGLFFRSANALDQAALKKALSAAKKKTELVIFCEGLLSYFDKKEKEKIAGIVKNLLEEHRGVWIATDPALNAASRKELNAALPEWKKIMKKAEKLAGQKYADHGFLSEKEADSFFKACGFRVRKRAWPLKLHSLSTGCIGSKAAGKIKNFLKRYGKAWILSLR